MAERCCYELVYPSTGEPVDTGDGHPHYESAGAASSAAAAFKLAEVGTPEPKQLDRPCVELTCTGCGLVYEEDDVVTHFGSWEGAQATARLDGWTFPVGRSLCADCAGPARLPGGGDDGWEPRPGPGQLAIAESITTRVYPAHILAADTRGHHR